jgi:uncharacterized protein YuzE
MQIHYDSKTDFLYLRLAGHAQPVTNKRISEDIVLDIGADDKIIGIEIMDASKVVDLEQLMPVAFLKAV